MQPLAGIKVIEVTENIAGPYAGVVLASLGADVIKVERPGRGDDTRFWGPTVANGGGVSFNVFNHDKRSITVDLQDADEVEKLKSLIADADIFVQNLRPGTMAKVGLDAETLRSLNARLIYCSLWAYGAKGPKRMEPGYEPIVQAFAGMFTVNGAPEGPPSRVGLQVLDMGTGTWAAMGCLAALRERDRTGKGCIVDTSLFETALNALTIPLVAHKAVGRMPQRHRSGAPLLGVFRAFETADGEINLAAANDRLFARFSKVVERPEWADDPRYATSKNRVANVADIIPQIEEIMLTRTTAEWRELLEAANIPCAPINDLPGIIAEEQTDAVGMFQTSPGSQLELMGLPIEFDGARPSIRRAARELGADNAAVFATQADEQDQG